MRDGTRVANYAIAAAGSAGKALGEVNESRACAAAIRHLGQAMNSFKKSNRPSRAVVDRRSKRRAKPVGATVTLLYQHKLLRGNYTIVGGLLIVSCGSVSTSVELHPGHPEAQARRVLFKLVSTGMLESVRGDNEH